MLLSERKVEMADATRMTDQGPAPDYAVLDGEIVAFDDAKVHILTHTFNYGTGVFEGIRGYWNARRTAIQAWAIRWPPFSGGCGMAVTGHWPN